MNLSPEELSSLASCLGGMQNVFFKDGDVRQVLGTARRQLREIVRRRAPELTVDERVRLDAGESLTLVMKAYKERTGLSLSVAHSVVTIYRDDHFLPGTHESATLLPSTEEEPT